MDRVVALVDMDCFYVQVEQRLNPSLKGKPCVVVQYKTWKGGGIIAVGYEARAFGVTRNMWGDEAKKKCPDVQLVRVPEVRGKADLTKYREAGAEVIAVLSKFSKCVERASIDEAYIDLTDEVERRLQTMDKVEADQLQNTFIVGYDKPAESVTKEEARKEGVTSWLDIVCDSDNCNINDHRLAVGAVIAEEMRAAVYEETGFRCSAGIAHNKMLAKLVCGFNKPNRQTVLPHGSVPELFKTLPIGKVRHLGGKLGQSIIEQLGIEYIGDLCRYTEQELQRNFGDKTGAWLFELCKGIEHEPVSARQLAKSIGCSKNFPGKTRLDTRDKVKYWLSELAGEVEERLIKDREMNKRTAKTLTVSVRYLGNPKPVVASRACGIVRYDAKKFSDDAFALLQKFNTLAPHQAAWSPDIVCLGLSASKFLDEPNKGIGNISSYLGSNVINNSQTPSKDQENTQTQTNIANQKQNNTKGTISSFFNKKVSKSDTVTSTRSYLLNKEKSLSVDDIPVGNDDDYDLSEDGLNPQLGVNEGFDPVKINHFVTENKSLDIHVHVPVQHMKTEKNVKKRNSIEYFFQNKDTSNCQTKLKNEESMSSVNKISKCLMEGDSTAKVQKKGFFASKSSKFIANSDVMEPDISPETSKISETFGLHNSNMSESLMSFDLDSNSLDRDVFDSLPNDIKKEILEGLNKKNPRKESVKDPFSDLANTNSTSDSDQIFGESSLENSDYLPCEKCGKVVKGWEMPEHLDFHFAQELQAELRTEQPVSNVPTAKRKLENMAKKSSNKKMKVKDSSTTLDSFFNKR